MIPGKYDLNLYRGDSYAWQLKLWNDQNRTDPTVLTGAVVAAQIRDKPSGEKIVDLGCTVTAPNIINLTISPGQSASAPPKGVWDLQITFADSTVQTPIGGTVKVIPDVTAS